MISCIYALLFLTTDYEIYDRAPLESQQHPKQVPHLNRLVLLSNGVKKSSYGSYKVGDKGGFPEIKVGLDIYMTKNKDKYENIQFDKHHSSLVSYTKILAYCSPTLSSTQIEELLAKDLVPAGNFHYPKLKDSVLSSDECMIAIRKELDIIQWETSSHTQILRQSSTCSNSDIIGLAFQGDISIAGIFSGFAPVNDNDAPKIAVDDRLVLRDLVTQRQVYAGWNTKNSMRVLIWYFGQLHIFERRKGNILWWPLTDIDHPEKNGGMILDVLRRNLGLFQKLDEILNRYSLLDSLRDKVSPVSSTFPPDKSKKVYRLMAEISDLDLSLPPWFFIEV